MQTNWSLILNVLLLIVVITAMGRLMKARKQKLNQERYQPNVSVSERDTIDTSNYSDDIIAVRKVNVISDVEHGVEKNENLILLNKTEAQPSQPRLLPAEDEQKTKLKVESKSIPKIGLQTVSKGDALATLMIFLLAKENRQFAGYELLQAVLAAGLRFGEGHLFHRHQCPNGQGPVLFSLATATATGMFDLQNMGAFTVRGLCLYMYPSRNSNIDIERFGVMIETARQLSEGLDAYLLDDQRKPLTEERIFRYQQVLQMDFSRNSQMQ